MEEKESTVSGSPGNSEAESPPVSGVVPQVMNMAINMSMERSLGGGDDGGGVGGNVGGRISGGGGGGSGSFDLLGRKKRGRPRKYDADGNLRLSYAVSPPPGFTLSSPSSDFSSKRGRGRPPGSGNWQLLASLGELKGKYTVSLPSVWLLRKLRKRKKKKSKVLSSMFCIIL